MVVICLSKLVLDDHDALLRVAEKQVQRIAPDSMLALLQLERQTDCLA
jgi:hypothetical protein